MAKSKRVIQDMRRGNAQRILLPVTSHYKPLEDRYDDESDADDVCDDGGRNKKCE